MSNANRAGSLPICIAANNSRMSPDIPEIPFKPDS